MRFTSLFLRPLLLCWLLFALLVLTLDVQSLWWDEGISLHLATSPWMAVIRDRAANIHPPLYFFALNIWVSLVGSTPFAARYASALAAALLPATAYRFLGRRIGRRAGGCAALLLALAPPFFIYGQEVRAYAFLPLLALALLAQIWPAQPKAGQKHWLFSLRLALIQAALCLSHYIGMVAVVCANVALLALWAQGRERRPWSRWAGAQFLTALLLAPWAWAVWRAGASGLRSQAGLGNVLSQPVPADYFLKLVGIFHLVGLPTALTDPLLLRLATLAGGLTALALLCLWLFPHKGQPSSIGGLLLAWLAPLSVAPLLWMLSPQAHPRYLLPFVLGLWLLWAALITAPSIPRLLRAALLAAVLVTGLLGLRAYLTEPRYARSDVRAVAAFVRDQARAGDVVLIPHTDWSLAHYDLGAAAWAMLPPPSHGNEIVAVLARASQSARHIYALDYQRGALDPRGQVGALLEAGGMRQKVHAFNGVLLYEYALLAPVRVPSWGTLPPACVESGALCLTHAAIQERPESGAALPFILRWRGGPVGSRYALAMRLTAPSGALVAAEDALLLNRASRPTDLWHLRVYH